MRTWRVAVLASLAAIGGAAACVADTPGDSGQPMSGTDASIGSDGSSGSDSGGNDGGAGSDGTVMGMDSGVDAGPPRFCVTEKALADASDFFCADFDDVVPFNGFVDASTQLTDGATLAALPAAAFSQPLGLATNIPANPSAESSNAALGWVQGGTSTISSMTGIVEVTSSMVASPVTATGDVYLMELQSGTVTIDYGYTKGGAVTGMNPYTGYLIHIRIATSSNYFPVPAIAGSGWTKVALSFTHGSTNSTVTLAYDGVQNFTQSTFPGTPNTSITALIGPQAYGSALGGSWSFDNFEVLTTR